MAASPLFVLRVRQAPSPFGPDYPRQAILALFAQKIYRGAKGGEVNIMMRRSLFEA